MSGEEEIIFSQGVQRPWGRNLAVTANKKVKESEGGKHRTRPENFQRDRGVGLALCTLFHLQWEALRRCDHAFH